MMWAIAGLVGLAAALLIWGGREILARKFANDVSWMRGTWARFSPNPGKPEIWVISAYLFYLMLLALFLVLMPHPIFAFLFWLVLLKIPGILVEIAWSQRRQKIDLQLAASITAMCNSIRAGLTLVQALQRLAEQAPEPIRTEFRVMANRYAYGADLESTITEAKARLALPNFNLFASALLLNREMGGDIAETLSRISQSLEKLRQMRQTVEAHTSEGRTNIKVLMIAPIFMLLMLSTVDGEGVTMLFSTPQGYAILLIAGLLTGLGVYFAGRITRSEV